MPVKIITALFGCNDYMAIGAMTRLREAGLRVPEDVSVVGFDDVDMAAIVTPGLTTVRQDMAQIGRRSAHLLIAGLQSGQFDAADSESLPTELIIRGSTGPAPK